MPKENTANLLRQREIGGRGSVKAQKQKLKSSTGNPHLKHKSTKNLLGKVMISETVDPKDAFRMQRMAGQQIPGRLNMTTTVPNEDIIVKTKPAVVHPRQQGAKLAMSKAIKKGELHKIPISGVNAPNFKKKRGLTRPENEGPIRTSTMRDFQQGLEISGVKSKLKKHQPKTVQDKILIPPHGKVSLVKKHEKEKKRKGDVIKALEKRRRI